MSVLSLRRGRGPCSPCLSALCLCPRDSRNFPFAYPRPHKSEGNVPSAAFTNHQPAIDAPLVLGRLWGGSPALVSWRRQTWDKTGFEIKFAFPGNFFGLTQNGSSIWQGGGSGRWEDRGRLAVPWLLLSGAYVGSFVPCLGSRK